MLFDLFLEFLQAGWPQIYSVIYPHGCFMDVT